MDRSGNQEFDREIGSLINRGFYGILTCWDVSMELDKNIVLVKGLVLVASTFLYNQGIVAIQIDTTIESSSPRY